MSTIAALLVSLKTDFGDFTPKVNAARDSMASLGETTDDTGGKIDDAGDDAIFQSVASSLTQYNR